MMQTYLLAIDQGTTGSTALILSLNDRIEVIGRKTVDFPQYYPKPGWVEHDLHEIWTSVCEAIKGAVTAAKSVHSSFTENSIQAIGITNQRETLCAFHRSSGQPAARAIVWQCRRTTEICKALQSEGLDGLIREKTGLVIDPYFSGTKLRWLMENHPEVAYGAMQGEVLFGTIDTYLLYRLTAGDAFKTEPSNASRTMMVDISTCKYDDQLLTLMKVPSKDVLPEIVDSTGPFGVTKSCGFLPDGIPITGILGDQQAALAGQTCFEKGEAKCTYGTGAFLLLNTGESKLSSKAGLVTTVAWQVHGKPTYAFEGSCFISGAAVQFIRDQLKFIETSQKSETLAMGEVAAPEVYFVPALSGLGAPTWDPDARGAILGLTRGTKGSQIVRATLEGMALQVVDLLKAMESDFPGAIVTLNVDGGACANDLLLQIQADFSGIPVDRPKFLETTAFGAALFAGLGAGIFRDFSELKSLRLLDRQFLPVDPKVCRREEIIAGWHRAIKATRVFAGTLEA